MGKRHSWKQTRSLTDEEWVQLRKAAKAIINAFEDTFFVPLGDRFGKGFPEFTDTVIGFNGYGDEGCESFLIHKDVQPAAYPGATPGEASCKTRERPYSRAVIAVLVYCEAVLKTHEVWSDATQTEWNDGVALAIQALGYPMEQALEGYSPSLAA